MARNVFETLFTLKGVDLITGPIRKINQEIVKLQGPIDAFNKKFEKARREIDDSTKSMMRLGKTASRVGAELTQKVTLPIAAAATASTIAFMKLQDEMINLENSTQFTSEQIETLVKGFQDTSKFGSTASVDLLKIAKQASAMGVKGVEDVSNFTQVMEQLGRVTDVSGEQGARSLLQFISTMGLANSQARNVGDVLTDLADKFGGSESEILDFADTVGKRIQAFGQATPQQVFGIAAAFAKMGIPMREAKGDIDSFFGGLNDAARENGAAMDLMTRHMGLTRTQLQGLLEKDQVGLLKRFADFFAQNPNVNISAALKELGIDGQNTAVAIAKLSKNTEILNEAVSESTRLFDGSNALNKEAARDSQKFSHVIGELWKNIRTFAEGLGEKFGTVLAPIAKVLAVIVGWLAKQEWFQWILVFGSVVAIVGPILSVFGAFTSALGVILPLLSALGITGVASFVAIAGPILAIPAAISAVVIAIGLLIKHWDKVKEVAGSVLNWIMGKISAVTDFFSNLGGKMAGIFGGGANIVTNTAAQGPPIETKNVNESFSSQTIKQQASVGISIDGLPKGSRVVSSSDKGLPLTMDYGMSMAY